MSRIEESFVVRSEVQSSLCWAVAIVCRRHYWLDEKIIIIFWILFCVFVSFLFHTLFFQKIDYMWISCKFFFVYLWRKTKRKSVCSKQADIYMLNLSIKVDFLNPHNQKEKKFSNQLNISSITRIFILKLATAFVFVNFYFDQFWESTIETVSLCHFQPLSKVRIKLRQQQTKYWQNRYYIAKSGEKKKKSGNQFQSV